MRLCLNLMATKIKMENINRFNFNKVNNNFAKMFEMVGAGNSCSIFGVQNSMRPAIVSATNKKTLYLTADMISAKSVAGQFEKMGKKVGVLPVFRDSFLYKKACSPDIFLQRLLVLDGILSGKFDLVVAPVEALLFKLPSNLEILRRRITLKENDVIERDSLQKKLIDAGYRREEILYDKGQFAVRGEVIDVFPINSEKPFRIDFFDNLVETIKIFDMATMKGTKGVEKIEISPCTDLFFEPNEREEVIKTLERVSENPDFNEIERAQVQEAVARLEAGDNDFCLDFLAQFLNNFKSSIFDYLASSGEDFLIVFDECKKLYDELLSSAEELDRRSKESGFWSERLSKEAKYFSVSEIKNNISKFSALAFLKITTSNKFFESKSVFSYKSIPSEKFTHNLRVFSEHLRNYRLKGYKFFIFAGSSEQAESISNVLASHDLKIKISDSGDISSKNSLIFCEGYESGFILPEEKIYVVGTYDIFPKKQSSGRLSVSREDAFSVPKVGDFVVHQYHGIGVCEGVTKLSGTLGTKDYVVIRYRDDDKLYVPTEQMDMLSKFSGAEAPTRLSKIGGADFSAVKSRVKQSIKKLAINLLEIYAKREKIKGFAFSEDNDLQREFENAFPYTETEDQLRSIEEIKKDMQSAKVMDRLLCGDVGFGKTEVALRAIFKAVMDGKQVAFIAPTTILSEQHYNSARSRMFDFGVNIEVLNRFKSKSETDRILKGIASGEVDLVCGTHRILSRDVNFKNLGLIILDEEQKFGVEDKEKLKEKYENVDCLTLSATPIPRTLNMSLVGIRDISVIATPPSERMPVQTYVSEFSENLVKDAVSKELSREGQVFVLFNNVQKIYAFAERLKNLCPEANILVAHGQMNSKELENVVYDFYAHKADILVCTTIIENGIDIENANTLIVCDADKLGLSQLYQIRGRVGRGARMAYAYLTYQPNKALTNEAYKRLDALSEFCELGSGFKLAMRDLEIRGGGNIFGAEQSGHMQKIGFDMYSKLLSEVVSELKGEGVSQEKNVLVKVALDAYVPETYIATSEERMIAYKSISAVDSTEEKEKLKVELVGAYGEIPREVLNLIDISLARKLAEKVGAIEIQSFAMEVYLVFENKEDIIQSEVLTEAIFKFKSDCSLDLSQKPMIKFAKGTFCRDNFDILLKFLLFSNEILQKLSVADKK